MDSADTVMGADRRAEPARARNRRAAGLTVIGSGLVAFVVGLAAMTLVRDGLHIRCSMGRPGTEGADTWTCTDGIGYLGVAAVLGMMWLLAVVAGALVALLMRHDRAARLVLTLLAVASVAWVLGWLWFGSTELVRDEYAPMTGEEYWIHEVAPAAIASALGLAAGLVALVLPGRASLVLGAIATLGLIIATVLQPGLSVNTVPAVGLLAAAVLRGAESRGRRRSAASPR